MRILAVDDDPSFQFFLKEALELESYVVVVASTGEKAEELVENIEFDLVLLDIKLPGENGFEVCRRFRRKAIMIPVILISGIYREDLDVIQGLDCGADDYLLKPFTLSILLAKMHAILRRGRDIIEPRLQIGDLVLNSANRQVNYRNKTVELTGQEYSILEFLMRHPDQIISRRALEVHISNLSRVTGSNLIDVYIRRLRLKLSEDGEGPIHTIKGAGYLLKN